jgi:hypothetical protein
MVRGEDPFDAAKVNAAFVQWTETAQKLPGLFPEPPKPGEETRALPKIWETKSDFEAKIAALAKVVADNKDKVKTLDELKVAMPLVSKDGAEQSALFFCARIDDLGRYEVSLARRRETAGWFTKLTKILFLCRLRPTGTQTPRAVPP